MYSKKVGFLKKKKLPQAAQLPWTRGSVERKRPTSAAKGAERLLGGPGGGAPRNAGGCVGAQPPHLPKYSRNLFFFLGTVAPVASHLGGGGFGRFDPSQI